MYPIKKDALRYLEELAEIKPDVKQKRSGDKLGNQVFHYIIKNFSDQLQNQLTKQVKTYLKNLKPRLQPLRVLIFIFLELIGLWKTLKHLSAIN